MFYVRDWKSLCRKRDFSGHARAILLAILRSTPIELNEALQEMKDHPVRLAMGDFTLWPADDGAWKSLDETRKQTQEQQLRHMWNQTESR